MPRKKHEKNPVNSIEKKYNRRYTKDEIRTIGKMWETSTPQEVANELGRTLASVMYMCQQIRKAGYQLPRKQRVGTNNSLMKEALDDLLVFNPKK